MSARTWFLLGVLFLHHSAFAAETPNVVVILSDDQGWGDLSVNGNVNLRTPNLDSLARDGARFERFYVCPVCAPTRAEFLTGRYHPRGGVRGVTSGGERLDLDEKTIADTFKSAGYATGAFGKWHNGTQFPYHPNARGFNEYYGFTSGHWGEYFNPPLEHNGQPVQGHGFITDDLTDHAITFIKASKDRPFFCYLPFNTPHSPMQVPDRSYDKFKNADLKLRALGSEREDLAMTRVALALCENIDENVGRVLKTLEELSLDRNTIVLYFSDNGPNSWRWNGGMRGRKGSTDEGGVRSPLLIRWPEQIRPGTHVKRISGAIDLLPTLADLAGIPVKPVKPFDGISLAPLLLGTALENQPDRMIFSHWNGKVSVRSQEYRLDAANRLYDMVRDPGQQRDVTPDHPEVSARLIQAVAGWKADVLPELNKQDDRPFPVGYREFPSTILPARDGLPHGKVRRSANAPNCSYFTNWSSTDDRITWDIEVNTGGRYEAVIHYTCASADVGSEIELSLNEQRFRGKVIEAYDPPLRGKEHDRVPRGGESYVKDFKPLSLGITSLKPGRGLLTLRALAVPSQQVIDVRSVVLRLIEPDGPG
ncbi:Arylsulfatase A [Singulisphaera sp. GP187]|uniref:sulfatase-like hydrolase/transferase n=1 Tax=Singulisphaera sp. GP187 TaxID=1882752 RepID=UPI0009270FF4|nr:sulfatase-like hydrolase/transferase [Singulisphaera sp. GP187]SIN96169.1 Arylsulfatase A [Singulisphaera sp. GP187]